MDKDVCCMDEMKKARTKFIDIAKNSKLTNCRDVLGLPARWVDIFQLLVGCVGSTVPLKELHFFMKIIFIYQKLVQVRNKPIQPHAVFRPMRFLPSG